MKKLTLVCAVMLIAAPVFAGYWDSELTADANTLALWHMNEQSGANVAVDASSNGNDATMSTVALNWTGDNLDPNQTWQPGKYGNAMSTYIITDANSNLGEFIVSQGADDTLDLGVLDAFTIEFWMNPNSSSTAADYIFCKGSGASWNVQHDGGSILFQWYGNSGYSSLYDSTALLAGNWYHVAIVVGNNLVDGAASVDFYINGAPSTQYTNQQSVLDDVGSNYNLYIGGDNYQPFPYSRYMGLLDDLRISSGDRMNPIPEPGTMSLFAIALAMLIRRKK